MCCFFYWNVKNASTCILLAHLGVCVCVCMRNKEGARRPSVSSSNCRRLQTPLPAPVSGGGELFLLLSLPHSLPLSLPLSHTPAHTGYDIFLCPFFRGSNMIHNCVLIVDSSQIRSMVDGYKQDDCVCCWWWWWWWWWWGGGGRRRWWWWCGQS